MYGADEEGGLEDARSDQRMGCMKGEKQAGRSEKTEWNEKPDRDGKAERNGRPEQPGHKGRADRTDRAGSAESEEKGGKNSERDNRPNRKERNANRKAAQGKIMLLDEDEMDFLTLDEEVVEEKPGTGREADDGKNPTGTERK